MKRRLVLVIWHDAVHVTHGWADSTSAPHKNDLVYSVGWLLRRSRKSLTIAQSDGIDTVANTLQIPVSMIEKVSRLQRR